MKLDFTCPLLGREVEQQDASKAVLYFLTLKMALLLRFACYILFGQAIIVVSSVHSTLAHQGSAFVVQSIARRSRTDLFQSRYDDRINNGRGISAKNDASFQKQLANIFKTNEGFVPISLAGRSCQWKNGVPIDVLLLSDPYGSKLIKESYDHYLRCQDAPNECINALPIPLAPNDSPSIRLLLHAYSSLPLSKTKMILLNSLLVNRDGGLYDNLPWSTWTIDPDFKERDAANNTVNEKYTMGKRVAYQRFMGKDWRRRLSNTLKTLLEDGCDELQLLDITDDEMMKSLSKRILEVEIEDARTEVKTWEERLAIKRDKMSNNDGDEYSEYDASDERMLNDAKSRLKTIEYSLQDLLERSKKSGAIRSTLRNAVIKINGEAKEAPYRGAIGYPPKREDPVERVQQYTSPYSLCREIINEQLNAEVVACVLEKTSLLEGNLVLGGAIVLERKGKTKSTKFAREEIKFDDNTGDCVQKNVSPQSFYIVECFSDEAIGIAIETGLPMYVESGIWEKAARRLVEINIEEASKDLNSSVISSLPILRPMVGFEISVEGERVSSTQDANAVRIPLSSSSGIFDRAYLTIQSKQEEKDSSVFSSYSPVGSLDEYDSLTYDDKARILLKLESFQGTLPRPRVVRSTASALDKILLPLIDETVRRQYFIRDAEERDDIDTANMLRSEMSSRHSLVERAEVARKNGQLKEAERLENEAQLLKASRADFTQDEGGYSRFLDRDDWYERETQARIARYKKSRGIE